jgi:hypothetical protein
MRSASWTVGIVALLLAGCLSAPFPHPSPIDPDAARADIARLIPPRVSNAAGWAIDIFAALDALGIAPTREHSCAVIAVIDQESNFQVDPVVPGLATLARREIESRASRFAIPPFVLNAAMELKSPNGKTYNERLATVRSEKDLSDLYEAFIGSVPLGKRLFEDWNPVRTAGPMQVNIAFAEKQSTARRYPYAMPGSLRDELFTRRGGVYFGTAHLLDYAADYDAMLYRFADFNAGQYASRNAAFQNAVATIAKAPLVPDGDLLRHGAGSDVPSQTELALRRIAGRLNLTDSQIHRQLLTEQDREFSDTTVYRQVMSLADAASGRPLPRATVPRIQLLGPKLSRRLSTDWYARRVDDRYRLCLRRADGVTG